MENIEEEIWRDISGYEGLYQVSNLGRIKRLPRVVIRSDGRRRTFCESISKGHLHNTGYYVINLTKNVISKRKLVHRLVAEAFLPNPNHYPVIHHIDANKTNERADNLMWCSYSFNIKHSYEFEGHRPSMKGVFGKDNPHSVPIVQISLQGEVLAHFVNIMEAARKLNVNHTNITACIKKRKKTAYGYLWSVDEPKSIKERIDFYKEYRNPKCRRVEQIKGGVVVAIFDSVCLAAKAVGLKSDAPIHMVLNGSRKRAANSEWRYIR